MNMWTKLATLVVLSIGAALGAQAQTADDAKVLQEAAIAAIKSKGLDGAVKEINAGGAWRKGTLYVVLIKFDGTILAHAVYEKLVGKNMLEAKDAGGKAFVAEALAAVKTKGLSQIDVRWANPDTKQIADATMVARRVPGQDIYVSSMVFK